MQEENQISMTPVQVVKKQLELSAIMIQNEDKNTKDFGIAVQSLAFYFLRSLGLSLVEHLKKDKTKEYYIVDGSDAQDIADLF